MAATTRTYGPEMHGQRMTYDEFVSAPWREGHQYELIHGRIVVAPPPRARLAETDPYAVSRNVHDNVVAWIRIGGRSTCEINGQ